MDAFNYQDRFHEALQKAFEATSPAVRTAYFELADFYRGKLGGDAQMTPSPQLLKRFATVAAQRKLGRRAA